MARSKNGRYQFYSVAGFVVCRTYNSDGRLQSAEIVRRDDIVSYHAYNSDGSADNLLSDLNFESPGAYKHFRKSLRKQRRRMETSFAR